MPGSPTARRRRLAIELKKLREEHQLTCSQVGEELDWSGSKVNRLETGQGRVQPSDVDALCRFYGTSDELRELLKDLAKQSKTRGWWHAYGSAVPSWFSVYVGLEQAASGLRTYECEFVPGLLQTADYARELHLAAPDQDPNDVERMINVRMERQALLTSTRPVDLWAILHQSVLHHTIGNAAIMRGQCENLLKLVQLKSVTIQVLPFDAGSYPAVGAFTILEFPDQEDPDMVYRDGLTDAVYLERPEEIGLYAKAFDNLRALSLSPQRSSDLIRRAAEGLS
ncbi:helix-turn-helix domain-containing protein [Streptomyces sp. S465]|uniref:helix-turn-helix domain-containing protein n=1 Tax=Streptomyces sp. S465 TaxID=2979468 RepID=UPI0022A83867|nr:helix-turn-helix transcriptional regulator [Streptomyces sp. S465]WAP57345.1 helix-turn-helix transcriptional regulator [Streptomyces sp. S465]